MEIAQGKASSGWANTPQNSLLLHFVVLIFMNFSEHFDHWKMEQSHPVSPQGTHFLLFYWIFCYEGAPLMLPRLEFGLNNNDSSFAYVLMTFAGPNSWFGLSGASAFVGPKAIQSWDLSLASSLPMFVKPLYPSGQLAASCRKCHC